MGIYNYNLPSGAQFKMTAPAGTTQAEADKIFYEQVAAGTFVGYKKGDSLTHPQEALNNFGISRLERGTAGVDDKTLLAVISGLPLVAPLPSLNQVPVANPINQLDYIQVTSNSTGRVSLGPNGVGTLTPQQITSLLATSAKTSGGNVNTLSQEVGVGLYGFNALQLERAGYIKPGYSERFCPIDSNTGANPPNFVEFMQSPAPWTGLHGVTSVNDIVGQQALQNSIQGELFQQSYTQLVRSGTIVPPQSATPTTNVSTGQVYDTTGTLVTTSALALLSVGLNGGVSGLFPGSSATSLYDNAVSTLGGIGNTISSAFSSLTSTSVGDIPVDIQNLGADAIASYSSSISSLATGAVGFASGTATQISGLASGLTGGDVAGTVARISSTVSGDIGALITTGSKYGTELATAWADSATSTLTSIGTNLGSLASNISESAQNAFNTAQTTLTNGIDSLAKASQFGINFSDFSLSSMVAGVQSAAGFTNTVDRSTVDAAVTRVIGSPLITPPVYELPSPSSLGTIADISSAKNFLAQAQSMAQSIGSKVVNIV